MPDLMEILANLSSQITPVINMMQGVAFLMGLWLVAGALAEIWGVTHDNALKYVPGKNKFSIGSAAVQLLIGGVLCAMGTLEMVAALSRTVTEEYVSARFLAYTPANGSFDEQRLAAMAALLGIMQVVGFVAMIKGWMTFNAHANGRAQAGMGTAFCWLLGGVVAWNFKWFVDMLNCSIGYNMIGMFAPFGVANACN